MKTVAQEYPAPAPQSKCPRELIPIVTFDWLLQIGLASLFFASSISKLMGNPVVIAQFGKLGFEPYFVMGLGILEVFTGILLFIPRVAHCGGVLAAMTLSGVIFSHSLKLGISFSEKGEFYLLTMGMLGLVGAFTIIYRRRGELVEIMLNAYNNIRKSVV